MRIFLDDEREPATDDVTVVRTWFEFGRLIHKCAKEGTKITFVSFDHDLGPKSGGQTGLDCAKELSYYDMDANVLSDDFDFYVHSQNPVGAENIRSYLNNYLLVKRLVDVENVLDVNPRKRPFDA